MISIVILRDATAADMDDVSRLYNALVESTTVAWTETRETLDERLAWFERQRRRGFPVIVAESVDGVVGFTSYGPFRGEGRWPGYRYTVEHSIHVEDGHWGMGIGRRLMETLIEHARDAGLHVMVGAVDGDNAASIAFHERLGFEIVARMPEVGRKFDRWLELVLLQRILA